MDAEFLRVVVRVVIVGGAILVAGAGTLLIAFRAFAPDRPRGDFRPVLLIAALLFFVLIVCVVLFRVSMLR